MVVGAGLDGAEFVVVGSEKLVIYARLTFLFVSCFEEFGDLCQELFGISLAGEAGLITVDASTWLPQAVIEGKRFWFVRVGTITSRSLPGIVGKRLNLCRFSRSFVKKTLTLICCEFPVHELCPFVSIRMAL